MSETAITVISVVGTLVMFGTICFVAWTTSRAKSDAARAQADVHTKLIERFGSGPELVEFLRTSEGREVLSELQQTPKIVARANILGGLRKGIVVGILGLGFLSVALVWPKLGMIIPGFLLLALGLGFFISTLVSLKLARSWEILPRKGNDDPERP